jgi:hypothetical protein
MAKGQQEEAVRSLLGPQGGLTHLQADLVRLALPIAAFGSGQ